MASLGAHIPTQQISGITASGGAKIFAGINIAPGDPLQLLPYAPNAPFNASGKEDDSICLPDTRVEVLNRIRTWIDGDDKQQIFWLSGWAGTGKSTIARTIAREYYDRKHLVASFFFLRGGGDISHARKFVGTIAAQLAHKLPGFRDRLQRALSEDQGIIQRVLRDQWRELIVGPLSCLEADSFTSPLIIIIDALDECEKESDIRQVLQLLADAQFDRVRLRVLITSRPEISIRDSFSRLLDNKQQGLVLHDISEFVVDHDISVFLKYNLAMIRSTEQVIQQLVRQASGLFIWAATACRFINQGRQFAAQRLSTILEDGSNDDLSTDSSSADNPPVTITPEEQLNTIYTTVLKCSLRDYGRREKKQWCKLLKKTAGTIILLFSPLSAFSLARLLDICEEDITQTLKDLHSILDLPEDRARPIRLHHPSFRDFLLDKKRCGGLNFWVDEKQAHLALATNCIQLMSNSLKQDICGQDAPSVLVAEVRIDRVEQCLPPEVQYACLYWVQHLQIGGGRISDNNYIHQFLQGHLLHWLEALSWMKKISEGILAIISLGSIALTGDCPQFCEFIQDAKRFAQYNRPAMEQTPLQIYLSALVFAPVRSKVRNEFQARPLRWMKRLPNTTRQDWSALLQTLEGHTACVYTIVFSKDGKMLASGSDDCTVRLWDPATGQCSQALEGHIGEVYAIAFSKDGKMLASGSGDHTVRLWDPATGQCLQTLEGHTGSVNTIVFSKDGKTLASGSDDHTVRLWDPATRQCLQTLEGYTGWVDGFAFSKDGKMLALGSDGYTVRIWDPATGQCLQTLKGHTGSVHVVAFSKDGKTLASGSDDYTVRVWDPATGQCLQTLKGHTGSVYVIASSNDGKMLASGSNDCTVRLWDPATGQCLQTLTNLISTIAFSEDGNMLASGSDDCTIRLWEPDTGQCLQIFKGHNKWVYAIAFSKDGKMLASGSGDCTVRLWDPATRQCLQTLESHTDSIYGFAFSKDGKMLASWSSDHTVRLWDPATGQCLQTLDGHTGSVYEVIFSKDGEILASGSDDCTIRLWDLATGQCLQTLESHTDSIYGFAFSKDGKMLASMSLDHSIRLWDPATGQCLQTLEGHTDSVNMIAFSKDGKMLASGSNDYTVRLWDTATGQCLQTFKGHAGWVYTIAFSKDGKMLASGSDDCTVRLWDPATGQCLQTFDGHTGSVYAIAFSKDGKMLASGSNNHTVQLWDPATGQCLQTLEGHTSWVRAIAFSKDGKMLASGSGDRTVRLWDPATGQCLQTLKGILTMTTLSLSTDGRYLNIDQGIKILISSAMGACHNPEQLAYTISVNEIWVTQNTQNLLWLPPEYRHPSSSAVHGNILALGYSSGQVIVFEFAFQI